MDVAFENRNLVRVDSGGKKGSPSGEAAEVGEDGTAINLTEMDSGELRDLVVRLEKERAELIEEKKERDEEFGRHRAMFKEMYMLKEGEIDQAQQEKAVKFMESDRLQRDNIALQNELAELKSVALIAETSSKEELESLKSIYMEEMASMEQAMRATIEDAMQSGEIKFQSERKQLLDANAHLKADLDEYKRRQSTDRNGILASMARKVGMPSPLSSSLAHSSSLHVLKSPSSDEESYNRDMRRAKDDADFLKSLVQPLEDEINVLKSQLVEALEKVNYYEEEKLKLSVPSNDVLDSLVRKFGAKEFDLSTASKSDVEMYFGVLQTQKAVLQEDAINCRRELVKVQKALDQERELSQYFRRCLTNANGSTSSGRARSDESLDVTKPDNVSVRSADDDSPVNHSSPSLLDSSLPTQMETDTLSSASNEDSQSLPSHLHSHSQSLSLQRRSTLNSMTSDVSNLVVSCAMCSNYESQLQAAQKTEIRLRQETDSTRHLYERLKEDLKQEQQFRHDMDRRITKTVGETQAQISELYKSLSESEKQVQEYRDVNQAARSTVEHVIRDMSFQREQLSKEVGFLERENSRLTDLYTQEWRRLQEEDISLPTDMEELHHLLLRYREDVIRSRVAKEHGEDGLKSELLFLRDQLLAEQQNKDDFVQMLHKETDALRERVGILDSEKTEVERQFGQLKEQGLEEGMVTQEAAMKELKNELTSLKNQRSKLEQDLHHCRSRAQALQVELDNSEAVQRDFVKLSQSLQVELEKIRQSENEVRWQLDDDVEECNSCHEPFIIGKKKVRSLKINCRHCGKIYCVDCLRKEALSGPHRRPVKVCDVCHTILNRDTAPYFSHSPPTTK